MRETSILDILNHNIQTHTGACEENNTVYTVFLNDKIYKNSWLASITKKHFWKLQKFVKHVWTHGGLKRHWHCLVFNGIICLWTPCIQDHLEQWYGGETSVPSWSRQYSWFILGVHDQTRNWCNLPHAKMNFYAL